MSIDPSISCLVEGVLVRRRRRLALTALATVSLMAISSGAHAEDTATSQAEQGSTGLQDIIVTAQRRAENVQDVPIAVSAISADALQAANATSLSDLARITPSVQIGGQQGDQLVVRGIGQAQPGLLSSEGAAMFIDGVYRARFNFNSVNFSDVSRLELLRGPQGTLYGKNALGGALNIYTKLPGSERSVNATMEYGSRNKVKLGAGMDIPLSDKVAFRVSGEFDKQDGYITNLNTGEKLGNEDYYNLHATLRMDPTDTLQVVVRGDYFREKRNGRTYVSLGGVNRGATRTAYDAIVNSYYIGEGYVTSGEKTFDETTDRGVSLSADWKVGPGTLTSITAYRRYYANGVVDADGTPIRARYSGSEWNADQFTQEIRYTGQTDNNFLKYTVGGFYFFEDGKQNSLTDDNADYAPAASLAMRRQQTHSYAVFGEGTIKPTDRLSLTAGVRYSYDKKYAQGEQYNVTANPRVLTARVDTSHGWSSVTWRGSVQYEIARDVMAYGTVSKGFKAGGYNASLTAFLTYDAEQMINYELGLKSELFDRRLRLNLAAYQMDYTDMQINQIIVVNTTTGATAPVVSNAGDARIQGFEAETTFLPTPDFQINGAIGYNDFKYTRLNPGTGLTLSNVQANAPKWTASVGAAYTFREVAGGDLTFRADYNYRSKVYFNASNTEAVAQKGYGLLGGRITYQSHDGWSAYLYGTNLTDKYYRFYGFSSAGVNSVNPGEPREIGVGLRMEFR